jgi:hypothetical protein
VKGEIMKARITFGAVTLVVMAALGAAAYAALPGTTVNPADVPTGFLAGATHIDDASVASFARAIKQSQGSNVVLQHIRLAAGSSVGWHTHPGPVIVLVVSGRFDYVDDRCEVTPYPAGTGFVDQGFGHLHNATAVGATELYAIYYLPDDATEIRENPAIAPSC